MQQEQVIQKSDFPQIVSSTQNQAVILTRINPEDTGKFFICAQDIIDGMAGDKSTLQTYEEFCNYLSEPNIIPIGNEEAQKKGKDLMKNKRQNQMQFSQKIETEKNGVKRLLSDKLQELYKNKCGELVVKLQEELEGQNKLFNANYEKLGQEIAADREKEAGLLKYEEIKKKVKELKEPAEIEDYLKQAYRSKMHWKTASNSIQTLGPRSEQFFQQLIENQLQNAPQLSNVDKLLEKWVGGLDKLISQVKADAHIFKNILCSCELQVPVQINNLKEFCLVTNEMLKQDTELIVKLQGFKMTEQAMEEFTEHLIKLTNLQHFVFDITGGSFPIPCIKQFIKPFEKLQKLKTVEIKAFGVKLADQGLQELIQFFQFVPKLEGLTLQLGYNGITNSGINALGQELIKLTNLVWIYLKLAGNSIKAQGLNTFCDNFGKIMGKMICMNLDFGAAVDKANKLESTGSAEIVKMIKKASVLKYLKLNLGNNMIDNSLLREFGLLLSELPALFDFTLKLQNNKIDTKGAKKIAKFLLNNKLCKMHLNLSGNAIKTEGAASLIAGIQTMELLSNLTLNVRNTEIKKGMATQMKEDLQKKSGREYEKCEFMA